MSLILKYFIYTREGDCSYLHDIYTNISN